MASEDPSQPGRDSAVSGPEPPPRPSPAQRLAAVVATPAPGLELLLFWGHRRGPGTGPGPGCLSQWWPAPFSMAGVTYPSAEHAMMAAKARLFDDRAALAAVLASPDPARAKAAGRAVAGFDADRWSAAAYDVVVAANLAKFAAHPDLAAYLEATADAVLVEASPYDRIWGIGLAAAHPDARRPARWRGANLLGFALMEVRQHLRDAPPAPDDGGA